MFDKTKKVKKINRCYNHAPNLIIVWDGHGSCPLCISRKANEILAYRVSKLKKRVEKLVKKLNPDKKNKKKAFWD